ncbi:glucosaminidase domain-containing protein [Wenzhouxiangella limi]|uniref:Bax protein n=1 Tax=Wenzhouxiangella limi TaxID=2707351 RepID=A0A845UXF3_9GAMM|nr:glucosaminidase domain-containing protein [Wenzhouxiangella limi]NDY95184.1 Bax protein [Wenzhouxiangella limi]
MNERTNGQTRWAAIGLLAIAILIFAVYKSLQPDRLDLPDFGEIEQVEQRKTAFFEFLAPIVAEENQRVLAQRERLLALAESLEAGERLPPLHRRWMRDLAREYELEWPGESREETLSALLRRIDTVPLPLALVQAAKESGWGLSRFAREGNNLFGQWCYSPGCGIVPAQRAAGARHEVAAFDSVRKAVRRYVNNLNTHESYRPLRELRQAERLAGRTPTALNLADGLILYSERREAYVEDIRAMLLANRDLIVEAAKGAEGATRFAGENRT